ncbi:hypothetical protein [Exiguobacterium flavidum]|uniref:hypothetical protein n=1 Tax=Exiguobacterium flavidum TaxID=2184695 RepID=UPI000DF72EF8|nr:hypothetical protein [Exiguobacterium flavidum]
MIQTDFTVVQYVNRQVRHEMKQIEPIVRIRPVEPVRSKWEALEDRIDHYGESNNQKLPGRNFDREV